MLVNTFVNQFGGGGGKTVGGGRRGGGGGEIGTPAAGPPSVTSRLVTVPCTTDQVSSSMPSPITGIVSFVREKELAEVGTVLLDWMKCE